uniref:tetratricopeptide repeat protein n=1 Tax=Flexithrix dorotheae TaxID=70993 RepID=UPI000368BFC9
METLLGDSEKVVLVNGLGGIGKTTVARRYLTLHQDKFDHIVFVEVLSDDTETNNSFMAALANNPLVFQNLNLLFDLEQGEEERFASVLSGLQNLEGNNLLLIDNAGKQLESLVNKLPGKPQWQVLVTSRAQLEGFTLYPLDTLSMEKAKELFRLHAGEVDDGELDALLVYIGCHTLTTELLAKTFKKSITIKSPGQLLELLKNKQLDHKKLAKKIVSTHAQDKEITLYTHLITAFTLAGLEETEIWLLKQFAVMPPVALEGEFILKVLQATEENEEEIADALQSLVQKGWILETENGQYKIHRMVQEVVGYQEEISLEDCESLINGVADLLSIDQSKDNPIDKFQWVPFGDRLLLHFSDEGNSNISRLENNLATVYQDLGEYNKAAQLLEIALESAKNNFGENHPTVA